MHASSNNRYEYIFFPDYTTYVAPATRILDQYNASLCKTPHLTITGFYLTDSS
jgi:hypothetical protein